MRIRGLTTPVIGRPLRSWSVDPQERPDDGRIEVRARSALGGGWLGWVVAVRDITLVEQRLGREAVIGSRHRPDGTELRWRQIGVNGLIADPQLPFLIQWDTPSELHSSADADPAFPLACLEIAGDP